MKITSRISHASVKIYINDTLHIHFLREKYLGMQSWQFENETMFYIELTMDGGVIRCDYDRRDLWTGVLTELEKAR